MKQKRQWLYAVLIVLSYSLHIFASDITLKNGDRITGTIVDQNDEVIVIETIYAGKVKISRSYVQKVSESTTAVADQKSTVAVQVEKAAPSAAAVSDPAPKNNSSHFRRHLRQFASDWEGSSNIGFSYTSGNSNNITLSTGLRASRISPTDGMTVYIRSLWNNIHGSIHTATTQNAFWGGARYDRNISKKVFGFLSYDFERDKPKRLAFRSVAGAGVGYRTIKNERTELELLVGGAWNRTWQAGADTDSPEGLAGLTLRHKLTSKLRFQNTFTFFQNITDQTEYRFVFDSTTSIDVTKRVGFYIALGDRFNNDPVGTSKKNDFLFTTGLKWNFGKKK